MVNPPVRTRIAPSPTGHLHIGTARTALFNELFAHQHQGQFIVRVEDTDQARSKTEYEQSILQGLEWLGLPWDEGPDRGGDYGPYRQSERKTAGIYQEAIERLLSSGQAYQVTDSQAIKLKVPSDAVQFSDLIRGEITVEPQTWGGDFIIARSIDDPVFHLAVVVDDFLMKISHVIRGEDHLTNTARHILLQRALGYTTPQYAHLPLLLDANRHKLSKRTGTTDLIQYRDQGYLPESVLNYLALLGWNPKDDQEFFTHDQLLKKFSIKGIQKGGAVVNLSKLDSINKARLQALPDRQLLAWGKHYFLEGGKDRQEKFSPVSDPVLTAGLKCEQGRVSSYAGLDITLAWLRPNWSLPDNIKNELVWRESDQPSTIKNLQALINLIKDYAGEFTSQELNQHILAWLDAQKLGRGEVLWPMRFALTGLSASPGPFDIAAALGKQVTVKRLEKAVERLQ